MIHYYINRFKKGAFQIAKETGCKIIPISIGNLYKWMPNSCLLPVARMNNVYIQIHNPIDPSNKTVTELKNLCQETVNKGLPEKQQTIFTYKKKSDEKEDKL